MNSQVSPDELTAENELICEKLLRWQPVRACRNRIKEWLDTPYGDDGAQWHTLPTPSFDTWAEAGLIMEALQARRVSWSLGMAQLTDGLIGVQMSIDGYKHVATRADGPTAIRAAALEYIKVMKP